MTFKKSTVNVKSNIRKKKEKKQARSHQIILPKDFETNIHDPMTIPFSRLRVDVSTFLPIERLDPTTKTIVKDEFKGEYAPAYSEKWIFTIVDVPIRDLPPTYITLGTSTPEERREEREKIASLRKEMIQKGFDETHPILLVEDLYDRGNKDEITLAGGNHRLQAVREMIQDKFLPEDFKIPTIIALRKNLHVPGLQKRSLKDDAIELIHVTRHSSLEGIQKKGLEPDLSEFTKEAYISLHEDEFMDEHGDIDLDLAYDKIEELPDMVFAIEKQYLTTALAMQTSVLRREKLDNLTVLGILPKCRNQFKKKEIASDEDYVTTKTIPPDCLCEITDWKDAVDKDLLQFLRMR